MTSPGTMGINHRDFEMAITPVAVVTQRATANQVKGGGEGVIVAVQSWARVGTTGDLTMACSKRGLRTHLSTPTHLRRPNAEKSRDSCIKIRWPA